MSESMDTIQKKKARAIFISSIYHLESFQKLDLIQTHEKLDLFKYFLLTVGYIAKNACSL